MIVYLAMLTFICLLAMISIFLPRQLHAARGLISLFGYTSMCIFVGLRDHVGADWDSYRIIFQDMEHVPLLATFVILEPLYSICNRLVYLAGGDIHLVNLICAAISLACLFNFSRQVDMDSNLLLFIATPYLLFVVGMGYTRQSVAVCIAFCAIGYLRKGREKMFYFFAILATLFHYSAIFLIIFWWIKNFKRTAVVLLGIVAILPILIPLLSTDRYVRYLNNDASMQSHGVWTRILLISLALLIIFHQKTKWAQEPGLRRVILRGAVALCFITLLSLFLSTLADRICLYLFFLYMLGMGSVIRNSIRPFKFLAIFLVVFLSYAVFLAWFGFSAFAAGAWFPYGISLYGNS